MARVKPRNSITNKQQAESAMERINSIDRRLAEWDLKEAHEVSLIRARFSEIRTKGNITGMEAEKELLIKELHAFAEIDSATWSKKTFETPFGSIGYRVSQPAVVLVKKVAKSLKQAVELLQEKLPDYIRKTPEVDKEAILAADRDKTLDETLLKSCGLEVKQEDEFWVESKASKDLDEAAKKLRAA